MKSIPIFKVFNGKHKAASVDERYLHHFTREGWEVKNEESHHKIDPPPLPKDVPVSEEERVAHSSLIGRVDMAETKEDLEKLVMDLYGVKIDKRGTIETVKEKAKAVINESKRVD